MENNNDDFPIKPLLYLGIAYAFYEIVTTISYAIARLLHGLVTITLWSAGILALFYLYRHITDKQYGETKKLQEIEKLERERKLHTSKLPKHMREQADDYYKEKQRAYYDLKTYSRADALLERTKQVLHVFRGKGKNE